MVIKGTFTLDINSKDPKEIEKRIRYLEISDRLESEMLIKEDNVDGIISWAVNYEEGGSRDNSSKETREDTLTLDFTKEAQKKIK